MSLVEPVDMRIGISSTASHHVMLSKKHTYMRQRSQVYASVCRSSRAVKDGVAQLFDVLVLVFGRVLMLLMQLTLPSGNV
jgi:hypothetical protein